MSESSLPSSMVTEASWAILRIDVKQAGQEQLGGRRLNLVGESGESRSEELSPCSLGTANGGL